MFASLDALLARNEFVHLCDKPRSEEVELFLLSSDEHFNRIKKAKIGSAVNDDSLHRNHKTSIKTDWAITF